MDDTFYDILARRYDVIQSDMDTRKWASYIKDLIKKHSKIEGGGKSLCDLGCGTGSVDVHFTDSFEVTGIDNAEEMLIEAASREGGEDIIWSLQDITDFEIPFKADCFVSLLDTLDHITDPEALEKVFENVYENLNPGGVFVFDVITEKHLAETFADNVFFYDYDEFTLLWVNEYDEETGFNTANLTFFEEAEEGLYRRYDGELVERFYSVDELKALAGKAGFKLLGLYGELSDQAPSETEERIFMVMGKDI